MKYIIEGTTLEEIAEAIREKTGESDAIAVSDMAEKIGGIEVGSGGGDGDWDDGYTVGYDEGYSIGYDNGLTDGYDVGHEDGYASGESAAIDTLTPLEATENGDYFPPEGSIGFDSVKVNVNVSSGSEAARNILPQVTDGTVTEITAEDLQGATEIRSYAFHGCSKMTSITIPDSVKKVGSSAFQNCSKVTQTESNVKYVDKWAIGAANKSVTSASLRDNTVGLAHSTFHSCKSLASVFFSENSPLKTIGYQAFYNCSALTSITVPKGVTLIDTSAFGGCTSLTRIVMKPKTPPTIQANTFENVPADCEIAVHPNSVAAYKSATNWAARAAYIVEDPNADEGGDGNWLFENEYIDFNRTDLPAPEVGVSYTCFVDGEEIGTATAGSWGDGAGEAYTEIEFMTEDCRVWLKYDSGTEYVWFFHPIDSAVQSGSVSIRING